MASPKPSSKQKTLAKFGFSRETRASPPPSNSFSSSNSSPGVYGTGSRKRQRRVTESPDTEEQDTLMRDIFKLRMDRLKKKIAGLEAEVKRSEEARTLLEMENAELNERYERMKKVLEEHGIDEDEYVDGGENEAMDEGE
ncbi:hypothetical protein BU24DRAFT_448841 [Aaosphaeria arxii CBS 175.79]|uniref:Uncharacterized protein n=1 Tax=Aaosphaeria arxii CBS 175.79 TaxID=1450172 RepID=A0A6A5XUU8_9PLEO|nr:uncharacterized protein BU24DRAFT_448841 [Aaosphaeria arxii CBS 175.79]KAF2017088.1 hypothetical protein BU24DRAFT_448841 [Aaosphaeria arxii CBS 175.79]